MRLVCVALLSFTILTIVARCAKSERPGPAPVAEATSSAPVATPDPHPPIAMMNTPGDGATVPSKSWGTGWALDDSGIAQVTATADNGAVSPAKIGQPFPGVKEAYPNMPDNDKAGFIFGIPDLPPGPHTLTVEVVAKDGGKVVLTRRFTAQ
jgi:hypothetical protein